MKQQDTTTATKSRRPRGDGSIQQLPNGKYKAQITIGYDESGKQRKKSFTGRTQGEVVKRLNEYKAEQLKGKLVKSDAVTVEGYSKRWLEIKKEQVKQSTYETYEYVCAHDIIPTLGKHKLQKLTTTILNDYFRSQLKSGLSPKTISKQRGVIHNLLDLAVKEGKIPQNPVVNCMTIALEKFESKTLAPEDITRLLEVAKEAWNKYKGYGNKFYQMYHMILLAITTGTRRGEMLGLKWNNVDFDKNTITIKEALVAVKGGVKMETPKTKTSRRVIAVDVQVLEQLKELKEVNDSLKKSEWVFCNKFGKPIIPANMTRIWGRLLKEVGIEGIRFHDLRHTHATLLVANGTNLKTVSARMGHNDIRITLDLYSHALPEQDREAATIAGAWVAK